MDSGLKLIKIKWIKKNELSKAYGLDKLIFLELRD